MHFIIHGIFTYKKIAILLDKLEDICHTSFILNKNIKNNRFKRRVEMFKLKLVVLGLLMSVFGITSVGFSIEIPGIGPAGSGGYNLPQCSDIDGDALPAYLQGEPLQDDTIITPDTAKLKLRSLVRLILRKHGVEPRSYNFSTEFGQVALKPILDLIEKLDAKDAENIELSFSRNYNRDLGLIEIMIRIGNTTIETNGSVSDGINSVIVRESDQVVKEIDFDPRANLYDKDSDLGTLIKAPQEGKCWLFREGETDCMSDRKAQELAERLRGPSATRILTRGPLTMLSEDALRSAELRKILSPRFYLEKKISATAASILIKRKTSFYDDSGRLLFSLPPEDEEDLQDLQDAVTVLEIYDGDMKAARVGVKTVFEPDKAQRVISKLDEALSLQERTVLKKYLEEFLGHEIKISDEIMKGFSDYWIRHTYDK